MRKLVLCFALVLPFVYIYSQDLDSYYLEIKEGYELGEIQKIVNADQTLTLTMQNIGFASALNAKPVFTFEKAFPDVQFSNIERTYLLSVSTGINVNEILNRHEVNFYEQVFFNEMLLENQTTSFSILPDDYNDLIIGGRNTALDLIRAPLAWTITKGNGILVGIADTKVDLNHEDLIGTNIIEVPTPIDNTPHGTSTAGMIAAKTNNNKGMASIAHESNLVVSRQAFMNGLIAVSNVPGVKVINTSWLATCSFNDTHNKILDSIAARGILVVSAAGNGPDGGSCGDGHGHAFPASYESTLSVTTVGERVAPGYSHDIKACDTCVPGYFRSWKDVHLTRPDTGNTSSHTHNDKVDVTSPGQLLLGITDDYDNFPTGYHLKVATSPATPIVTGVAALVFAANPNLTAQQVKDIIMTTADDIYHIPWNQPYVGQLGTGRVNAYRAVLTAKCMDDPNYIGELDLMVRNSMVDYGVEPDQNTEEVFWNTQEIWVRHNSGESYIDVHQNPEYDPVEPNYVNVRVTNRSCITSSGNDTLELYWAKSHAAPSIWPDLWDGSMSIDGVTLGGQIATVSIPELTPGKEAIIEIPWLVPNPEDFQNIGTNPWHFCLVARIVSNDDPMTVQETSNLPQNVVNNNNIAWKNMNIVDVVPNTLAVGSITGVGNFSNESKSYKLVLKADDKESGSPIYQEAEIGVVMDEVLYAAWQRGNKQGSAFLATSNEKKLIATDDNFTLDNLQFLPNEFGTAYITFNFLTKKLTDKRLYTYHVIQKDNSTNEVVGGVTYEVRKQPRAAFLAHAGGDEEIDRSDSITLQAADINEDAIYNWYDVDGNLIYTGTSITVSPQFTQQYKLEVISNLDGLKDYDELQVTVNPYKIQSLVPNPATSTVTVNYVAYNANSAYIMFVNQNSGSSDNYILDTTLNTVTINVSSYPTSLYSVILVANGEVQDSKNLIKN